MKLTDQQLAEFDELGYLFTPSCFSEAEIQVLRDEAEEIYKSERNEVWREDWIAHRDFTPIDPVSDDALLEYARSHSKAA